MLTSDTWSYVSEMKPHGDWRCGAGARLGLGGAGSRYEGVVMGCSTVMML